MHGIGNEKDAQLILNWVRSSPDLYGRPEVVEEGLAPEGWRFIGSGSFRSVWCSPEGVAYKVEHDDGYGSCQSEQEVVNLEKSWEKGAPKGCRLPKFSEFIVDDTYIIAMELIKGITLHEYGKSDGPFGDYYDLMNVIENRFRLTDMHNENVMVDEDGYLVPVDLGA